ncbi:MAG: outer membrane beta-barrel protein [Oligoflexia bacterium]|nr:outer membrane beta-barrel protein [Oligoflexia bacterium]
MKLALTVLLALLLTQTTFAQSSKENWSIGLLGGITAATQSDMNLLITRANARVGGISTGQIGNAWEFGAYLQKRYASSIIALQLRPTYFTASTTGTGTGGTFAYSTTGYTISPLLKLYILESSSIKLYLIGGVIWGKLMGKIQEGSAQVEFDGSNSGFQGGLGALFCFGSKGTHCFFAEGNYRYLVIERNTASSVSGSFTSTGANRSLSQAIAGAEVELDARDLGTTMAGVQGFAGYQLNF